MIIEISIFTILVKLINRYIKESVRYFCLHFIFNMYILFITYNDTIYCIMNPLNIFDNEYDIITINSTKYIIFFHMYHIINSYYQLTFEDLIHHIVSCFMMGYICISFPLGKIGCIGNFALCGLPGGIDYLLLILVKYNIINKITEKRINRYLNLLIRYPFTFLTSYFLFLNIIHEKIIYNNIIPIFIMMLTQLGNSIYYCDKVIGNYHINLYLRNT